MGGDNGLLRGPGKESQRSRRRGSRVREVLMGKGGKMNFRFKKCVLKITRSE